MDEIKLKLWMPVTKDTVTGEYKAILSDTSLDRDDEAMAKELILDWGKTKALPSLANHENKMQSWVGGWKDIKAVEKGAHSALQATPMFFSKEANPLASQIKKQIDEALEMGLNPGISVGAIVHEHEIRKINGHDVKVYTKGELLEATWVPIQSNRNANYGHVAKQFNIEQSKDYKEENKMEQKDVDDAVKKAVEDNSAEFKKQFDAKEKELDDLKKSVEAEKKKSEDLAKELSKAKSEHETKVKELDAEVKKAKETALHKQNFQNMNGQVATKEDESAAIEKGMIPCVRM